MRGPRPRRGDHDRRNQPDVGRHQMGYGDTSAAAVAKASDLALLTVRLGQTTFPELAASIGRVTR